MTLNQFAETYKKYDSELEARKVLGLTPKTFNSMRSMSQKRGLLPGWKGSPRAARKGSPNGVHPTREKLVDPTPDVEREAPAHNPDAIYWAGVFDTVGDMKIKTAGAVTVVASISTRVKLVADMFYGRYGGTQKADAGVYAVVLGQDDDGCHRLVCDLANRSVRFGDMADKLCQYLEYRFYLRVQEQQLIREFGA